MKLICKNNYNVLVIYSQKYYILQKLHPWTIKKKKKQQSAGSVKQSHSDTSEHKTQIG